MTKKIFLYSFLINLLFLNILQVAKGFSLSEWEDHRRHAIGTHYGKTHKTQPEKFIFHSDSSRLTFSRSTSRLLFSVLFLTMIAQQVGATVPSSLPENGTSLANRSVTFEDSRNQFSAIFHANSTETIVDSTVSSTHSSAPSPEYFSLDRSIPLESRTTLYTDMEKAYRAGEVCEPETFAVIKNLPATHPLQEMLKGCDGINAIYRKPEKLKAMNIAFSDKALSHEYKVVPQHRYAISEDKILFTGNVMKCVAIGIHNPTDERGGLAHVAGENIRYLDAHLQSDGKSKTGFHEFMEKVAGTTKPEELKVTVLSGSKAHIEYYVRFMKAFGIKNFTIIQKDEWADSKNNFYNKKLPKGSLAVNPRNNRVYRIKNDRAVSEWMGPPFGAPATAMRLTEEE